MDMLKNRCTGVLMHPSLITLLCKLAGVSMSESEEKTPPKLPLPVLKSKEGSTYQDTNAEDEGDATPVAEKKVQDDETTIELPQGHIDPWVQQMITASTERAYKAYEALA